MNKLLSIFLIVSAVAFFGVTIVLIGGKVREAVIAALKTPEVTPSPTVTVTPTMTTEITPSATSTAKPTKKPVAPTKVVVDDDEDENEVEIENEDD